MSRQGGGKGICQRSICLERVDRQATQQAGVYGRQGPQTQSAATYERSTRRKQGRQGPQTQPIAWGQGVKSRRQKDKIPALSTAEQRLIGYVLCVLCAGVQQ